MTACISAVSHDRKRFSTTLPPHTAACVFFFFFLWMTSTALTFILKGSFTVLTVISWGNPTRVVCSIQQGHRKKTFDVSFHHWHQVDIKCGLWLYHLGSERMWKNFSAFVKACQYLFQFPLIVTPHGWNYSFLSHSRKFPFSATCKATHLPSFPDSLWAPSHTVHTDMASIITVTAHHAAFVCVCVRALHLCTYRGIALPLDGPCAFSFSHPINLLITFKWFAN